MTHTSTEQPEALPLQLAQFFKSMQKSSHRWWDGTPVHIKAAEEFERLHARVQELEAAQARVQDRLDRLYLALEVCSAELFAQCADQGRAMKYVDQARSALAAEQCARAAQAKQGGV